MTNNFENIPTAKVDAFKVGLCYASGIGLSSPIPFFIDNIKKHI